MKLIPPISAGLSRLRQVLVRLDRLDRRRRQYLRAHGLQARTVSAGTFRADFALSFRRQREAFTSAPLRGTLVTLWRVALLPFDRADLYVDEAQYWFWGQELAWGYYSKPPLIGWASNWWCRPRSADAEWWRSRRVTGGPRSMLPS